MIQMHPGLARVMQLSHGDTLDLDESAAADLRLSAEQMDQLDAFKDTLVGCRQVRTLSSDGVPLSLNRGACRQATAWLCGYAEAWTRSGVG